MICFTHLAERCQAKFLAQAKATVVLQGLQLFAQTRDQSLLPGPNQQTDRSQYAYPQATRYPPGLFFVQ